MRSRASAVTEDALEPGLTHNEKVLIRTPDPVQISDPVHTSDQFQISDPVQTLDPAQASEPIQTSDPDSVEQKKGCRVSKPKKQPLSRQQLEHLLSVMEGEVQARDDVLAFFNRPSPDALEAEYGCAAPFRPLHALQRDATVTHGDRRVDVYATPIAELDRLEQKHSDTYRRMLEQLLLAEKLHRRTVRDLDSEKQKHREFICQSDDFTDLLERDRERLKHLLEQEKSFHQQRDREHALQTQQLRSEVSQLKSFALLLVDQQQLHEKEVEQRDQKIQDLCQKLQERDQHIATNRAESQSHAETILRLETELEKQAVKVLEEQEDMTDKLLTQDSLMRNLRLKLGTLSDRIEELEERNKLLQKSENHLKELDQSGSRYSDSCLVAELETLRKKMVEMEGKDEELSHMEAQSEELRARLQSQQKQSNCLKLELEKVQKKMGQMEKLEGAFTKSLADCSQLHLDLERERRTMKELSLELEAVKAKAKELELVEAKFNKSQVFLSEDVTKLKALTAVMAEERRNLVDRLKLEEEKRTEAGQKFEEEQAKVTEVTEKLIEERKTVLRLTSEMEKLTRQEETQSKLNAKLASTNTQLEKLENREKDLMQKLAASDRSSEENRRLSEDLRLENDKLQARVKRLEMVEGDLMKTEDQYDSLEKLFQKEQEEASRLTRLSEGLRAEAEEARSKAAQIEEKETQLRARARAEERQSEELRAEVHALKEKVHELLAVEDALVRLQRENAQLERRCSEEEALARRSHEELHQVRQELEAMARLSRVARRRTQDIPLNSVAVQTERTLDETAAGFIRKSVQEENSLMKQLRQSDRKPVLHRFPPAFVNTPPPSPPLRIRFTPHSESRRATLEISGPKPDDFYKTTSVIQAPACPKITIVPKLFTNKQFSPGSERAQSPVTITAVSKVRDRPGTDRERVQSPVSIVTVSTTPLNEAVDGGRSAVKLRSTSPQSAFSPGGNITRTEDNTICIHLGAQHSQRGGRERGGTERGDVGDRGAGQRDSGTKREHRRDLGDWGAERGGIGTERGDRGTKGGDMGDNGTEKGESQTKTIQVKKSSSIMIQPMSASKRTTHDSTSSQIPAQSGTASSRVPVRPLIPVSFLGLSSITRLQSRAESLKIHLRTTTNGPN